MIHPSRRPLATTAAAAALAGLAVALVWVASVHLAIALASLVAAADMFDVLLRLYQRSVTSVARPGTGVVDSVPGARDAPTPPQPYALVASIHEASVEIGDLAEALEPYRDRVWLIDDASTDGTRDLLHRYGFRCRPAPRNLKKPGAIRELLRSLPSEIETVVVFDPDMTFVDSGNSGLTDLEVAVRDLQRSGAAAACPRVRVRAEGLLTLVQRLEYDLAICLGREALGELSVNSGVSIYRRDALEAALERHSLSVYAEDLETSVLLLADGENVYLDARLEVETEGATSLGALFSQRVGWAFGHMKVYAERGPELLRVARRRLMGAYQYLIYLGVLGILMQPLRVFAFALAIASFLNGVDALLSLELIPDTRLTEPYVFAILYAEYTLLALLGLAFAVPLRDRWRLLPAVFLYFPYAIFLGLPVTVGFLNWLTMRWTGRRVFRDHYQDLEGEAHTHERPVRPRLEEGLAHG